jgi:uncharacterized MAPEG superfamily protein
MTTQTWLLASAVMTALMWVPYVLDRLVAIGVARTLGNPQPGDADEQSAWARRAKAAHGNAIENFAVFGPVVLLAISQGVGDRPLVTTSAAVYFVARAVHFVVYTAGVPVVRTLSFLTGWGAVLAVAWGIYAGG